MSYATLGSAFQGSPGLCHLAVSSWVPLSQLLDCLHAEGTFSLPWCQNLVSLTLSVLQDQGQGKCWFCLPWRDFPLSFRFWSKEGPFSSHTRRWYISSETPSLLRESSFVLNVSKGETINRNIHSRTTRLQLCGGIHWQMVLQWGKSEEQRPGKTRFGKLPLFLNAFLRVSLFWCRSSHSHNKCIYWLSLVMPVSFYKLISRFSWGFSTWHGVWGMSPFTVAGGTSSLTGDRGAGRYFPNCKTKDVLDWMVSTFSLLEEAFVSFISQEAYYFSAKLNLIRHLLSHFFMIQNSANHSLLWHNQLPQRDDANPAQRNSDELANYYAVPAHVIFSPMF